MPSIRVTRNENGGERKKLCGNIQVEQYLDRNAN